MAILPDAAATYAPRAVTARIRANLLPAFTLSAQLTAGSTTLSHAELANYPVAGSGDYLPIIIGDEVVYLTSHSSGATSGTITRGQEGTTDQTHAIGTSVHHGPTARDFPGGWKRRNRTSGNLTYSSASWGNLESGTATDVLPLDIVFNNAFAGDVVECYFSFAWLAENLSGYVDAATIDGSGNPVNSLGIGGTPTAGFDGIQSLWGVFGAVGTGHVHSVGGSITYELQTGDIVSGSVKIRLRRANGSASTRTILAGAEFPLTWGCRLAGPETTGPTF